MMRINLLPAEARGRSASRIDWLRMAWIGAGLLLAVAIVFTVLHEMNAEITRRNEADLFLRVEAQRKEEAALARQRGENDEREQRLGGLEQLIVVEDNLATLQLLAESTGSIPADVWLESLTLNSGSSGTSLSATGYAAETGDLSRLLRNLHRVAGAEEVQLETMGREDVPGGFRRGFSVRLTSKGATP